MFYLKGKNIVLLAAICLVAVCWLLAGSVVDTSAKIKEVSALENPQWSMVAQVGVTQEEGWPQSMCVTDQYIVCFENTSNNSNDPDTLLAFYKNDYDENGNPVERYSLAKVVTERDYEHGNGMAYNRNTNEIIIAPSKPRKKENRGIIYKVDANTLLYKETVLVADEGWRVEAVEYDAENRQYILLEKDTARNYRFVFTDEEFHDLHYFDAIAAGRGIVCQDFTISGDYMLLLTTPQEELGGVPGLLVFSRSQEMQLANYRLYIDGIGVQEAESIAEVSPGHILVAVGIQAPRSIGFFETELQAVFKVTTSVEHGDVTGGHDQLDEGSNYTVTYTPDEDYELSTLFIDGVQQDIAAFPNSYTFENLSSDHTLDVAFKEIPKFDITTSVTNGSIDDTLTVRRDKDGTVSYRPRKHYELDQVLVDGTPVENPQDCLESYTFVNVQGPHHIEVKFKEIPSYAITTEVVNGSITKSQRKVYRDENFDVEYYAQKDYELSYIQVDDQWMQQIPKSMLEDYTFENVQGPHNIKVVYQWKYTPYILFGALSVLALICGIIYGFYILYAERRRKRDEMIRRRIEDRLRMQKELQDAVQRIQNKSAGGGGKGRGKG
ncbi:MAG: hypothetical protein HFH61_01530 [Lachnospiraceae bacterium]|nr:hypothetical protein [Lachnospiraceae bacterium]